jgi:hypothetical protein
MGIRRMKFYWKDKVRVVDKNSFYFGHIGIVRAYGLQTRAPFSPKIFKYRVDFDPDCLTKLPMDSSIDPFSVEYFTPESLEKVKE